MQGVFTRAHQWYSDASGRRLSPAPAAVHKRCTAPGPPTRTGRVYLHHQGAPPNRQPSAYEATAVREMGMADESVRDLLEGALTDAGVDPTAEVAEGGEVSVTTPDSEGAQPDVEPQADPAAAAEPEPAAAGEGTADAVERYFEVDLSGLDAEARADIVKALRERDDHIGKLLREKAEGKAPADPADPAPEPEPYEPPTDEALAEAFGLDIENPFDESALKLARTLVPGFQQMQQQLSSLVEQQELDQLADVWNTTLDGLEQANGELPIDRIAVLEWAAENGIYSPEDAYWRIAGPAKREVERLVAERVAAQPPAPATSRPSKQEASTTRPTTSSADTDTSSKAKSLKGAVEEEAKKVLRDLGLDT